MLLKADETIGPWRRPPRLSACRWEPRGRDSPTENGAQLSSPGLALCSGPQGPSEAEYGSPSWALTRRCDTCKCHRLLEDRRSGCGIIRSPAFRRRQLHAGGVVPGHLAAGSTLSPGLSLPVVSRKGTQAGAWGQFRAGAHRQTPLSRLQVHPVPVVCPWGGYLTFLCLRFLIIQRDW